MNELLNTYGTKHWRTKLSKIVSSTNLGIFKQFV